MKPLNFPLDLSKVPADMAEVMQQIKQVHHILMYISKKEFLIIYDYLNTLYNNWFFVLTQLAESMLFHWSEFPIVLPPSVTEILNDKVCYILIDLGSN